MMNTKKFAVVFLPSEKMYSEVPVSWITDDEKQCWWPKTVNATSYMIRGELPNVKTWELHDIVIETFCSTLEGAMRAEDPSYLTSDDIEETGRGRRKKKNIVWSSSEGSITPPPSPPEIQRGKTKAIVHYSEVRIIPEVSSLSENKDKSPGSNITEEIIINEKPSEEHSEEHHTQSEIFSGSTDSEVSKAVENIINEVQDIETMPIVIAENGTMDINIQCSIERLTRICLDIQKNIQSLHKTVKRMQTNNGHLEVENYSKNLEEKLPSKTLEDLESFDACLSDVEIKGSFISYMKSVGGRDLKDNVNRCLSLVYTNNLGKSCSLQGKRGNFKLGETYAMKLFIDIMVSQNKTSISEVQSLVSEWFRLAKQRFLREK